MRHEAVIGRSFYVQGSISCDQDLIIEGTVEGQVVDVRNNTVTVGIDSVINGDIRGDYVIIMGKVKGSAYATTMVELRASGTLEGDIHAPRFHLEDGCVINGHVRKT